MVRLASGETGYVYEADLEPLTNPPMLADQELGDAAIVLEGVVAGAYSAGIVRDDRLLPVADFEVVAGQRTDVDVRAR